jgi:hypothetical protein
VYFVSYENMLLKLGTDHRTSTERSTIPGLFDLIVYEWSSVDSDLTLEFECRGPTFMSNGTTF